jgi:hypothetical protein
MRTETRKYEVYKVDELSDKAKENAYWKWLKGFEYDASDNRATLKAFEEIFKVKVSRWNYDACTYNCTQKAWNDRQKQNGNSHHAIIQK